MPIMKRVSTASGKKLMRSANAAVRKTSEKEPPHLWKKEKQPFLVNSVFWRVDQTKKEAFARMRQANPTLAFV